jgi:hypothetical protein
VAYNSHTGIVAAGQRVAVRNVYNYRPTIVNRTTINRTNIDRTNVERGGTVEHNNFGGRPGIEPGGRVSPRPTIAAPAPHVSGPAHGMGDLYAAPGGDVFRRSPAGGWEQHAGGGWQHAAPSPGLDRASQARGLGEQRTQTFRSMGGFHGGFGGVRGGFGGMHGRP